VIKAAVGETGAVLLMPALLTAESPDVLVSINESLSGLALVRILGYILPVAEQILVAIVDESALGVSYALCLILALLSAKSLASGSVLQERLAGLALGSSPCHSLSYLGQVLITLVIERALRKASAFDTIGA